MSLLYRIERHLNRTGMSASAFGRAALKDAAFVRDMRRGREPRPKTEARVQAFIASAECEPEQD